MTVQTATLCIITFVIINSFINVVFFSYKNYDKNYQNIEYKIEPYKYKVLKISDPDFISIIADMLICKFKSINIDLDKIILCSQIENKEIFYNKIYVFNNNIIKKKLKKIYLNSLNYLIKNNINFSFFLKNNKKHQYLLYFFNKNMQKINFYKKIIKIKNNYINYLIKKLNINTKINKLNNQLNIKINNSNNKLNNILKLINSNKICNEVSDTDSLVNKNENIKLMKKLKYTKILTVKFNPNFNYNFNPVIYKIKLKSHYLYIENIFEENIITIKLNKKFKYIQLYKSSFSLADYFNITDFNIFNICTQYEFCTPKFYFPIDFEQHLYLNLLNRFNSLVFDNIFFLFLSQQNYQNFIKSSYQKTILKRYFNLCKIYKKFEYKNDKFYIPKLNEFHTDSFYIYITKWLYFRRFKPLQNYYKLNDKFVSTNIAIKHADLEKVDYVLF